MNKEKIKLIERLVSEGHVTFSEGLLLMDIEQPTNQQPVVIFGESLRPYMPVIPRTNDTITLPWWVNPKITC